MVAQDDHQLTLDAQLRTRGEYNNGAIKPRKEGELPATFVNERARLSMDYQHQNLEMKLSLQHTGVWGQDDIKDRNGRVAMNEAWAKLRFCNDFFAQIGRQQLSYDDERLLGSLDWNVAGNYHDAIRVGYEKGEHQAHLIAAFNQTAENVRSAYYPGPMPYKSMFTLWYHYQSPQWPLGASVLLMDLGREVGTTGNGQTNHMQTLGTHLTYKPDDLNLAASFYYQTGKDATGKNVSAWMASAQAAYDVDPLLTVTAGYDYLSGNDLTSKNTNAFDPLFGTHHKFLGAMDYFTSQTLIGLQDIRVGASTTWVKNLRLQLDYHYMMTTLSVFDYGVGLGHEIDLQLGTTLMKDVQLTGGYSVMLGTKTLEFVKGGNHHSWQDWAWISLNINPRLLSMIW